MRSEIIIGTAGHIDHGKTSLVHALCGIFLDSTPEEKERGITINLGFAQKILPSGKVASFIDVPGHEKLIRTMISGATSMDAVLLCISAVDGVMPQTREHVSILKLLGIKQGIIALTMSDLVDEEMVELALLDIEELVEGSFLENAPVIVTAIGSTPKGISELEEAIDTLKIEEHIDNSPFRLSIDRFFVQKGFGIVVTGTARGCAIEVGSTMTLFPQNISCRVRSIQHHGQEQQRTRSGERTAINIVGVEKEQLHRGSLLFQAESIPSTSIMDVRYQHLANAPHITDGARVRFLHASTEVLARFSIISDQETLEEGSLLLQLRTDKPVVLLPGDRFILRQESPLCTLGGGVVIDPFAQRMRKKNKEQIHSDLLEIESGNKEQLLTRRGIQGASKQCISIWGCQGITLDERWISGTVLKQEAPKIESKVQDWHKKHPLVAGCPIKELIHMHPLPISEKDYSALLSRIHEMGVLDMPEKGLLTHPLFSIQLTEEQEKHKNYLLNSIQEAGLEGNDRSQYANDPMMQFLLSSGLVVRIQNQIVSQQSLDALCSWVHEYFLQNKILTPNALKEYTLLSRKYAIPVLEWLDAKGYTLRIEEGRIKREHS